MWGIVLLGLMLSSFITVSGQGKSLKLTDDFYQDSLHQWYELASFLRYQQELVDNFIPMNDSFPSNWKELEAIKPKWTNNIWLKLLIDNATEKEKDLTLLVHADLLDTWLQKTDGHWQHQIGGNLRPRALWDSRQHKPMYASPHTIQFTVPPSTTTILFIKVGAIDINTILQPKLCNRAFFLDHSTHYFQRTIATQSFFHGVLLLMFLFPLGMFLLNKDRAYLFYAGYTLSISVFIGYYFEFQNFSLLAEYPRFGRILSNLSSYAFPFFYNLFLIHFLHFEHWHPDIKKRLYQFNRGLGVMAGLTSLGLLFFEPTTFKLIYANWLYFPVVLIGLGGLSYFNWQYWRSNNQLARFVALNNLFLLIGLIISALIAYMGAIGFFDVRTASFWGILFLEATIVLQLLSFSLSLSYRSLETEREKVKLKELDRLKSRFFANISHEFRTPLTLILGPVQQVKAQTENLTIQKQLKTAEKYAQNLLRLVNQILDLTKLEVGKMQLEPKIFDWIKMAKVITYSFESTAQQQQIQLVFKSVITHLPVSLDQSKMEQILINLIANALKFTPKGGKVEVESNLIQHNKSLQIVVRDNGIGISEADQKYIFQHFYQVDHPDFTVNQPSSGIGLSLTKELVNLHNGTIEVKSQRGLGTSFIIELPLKAIESTAMVEKVGASSSPIIPTTLATTPNLADINRTSKDQVLILVVEDHPDIQQYIQSCLTETYQVVLASDGEMGIEKAIQEIPDLIITDIMMPKKDGYELTTTLKKHTATSHIPIIMLTGKSGKASKIAGLQATADDYLTKPFDAEELRLRINNLIINRQKWVRHFQNKAISKQAALSIPSMEDVFIQKALKVVEENLGDEQFSVEKLGQILRLDRTQLFRKLKAITGQNPSKFIRTVRLKKAYTLLSHRSATVGEIAFSVGFSSTNYFNRCFKEQFGKTPGAVMNEQY